MSNPSPETYAQSVLDAIGMPISPENISSILAYLKCGGNPSDLSADRNSAVRLALEHNSPRPVFGNAIGGSLGECIANTSVADLVKFQAPDPTGRKPTSGGNPLDALTGIGNLLQQLTSPTLWLRVGQFLLGGMLLLLGVYLMASENAATAKIKSDVQSAAVVAAAA